MSPAGTADPARSHRFSFVAEHPPAQPEVAARLAKLGFPVKEMIGGLEYWRREGHPVQGTEGEAAPMHG